MNIWSAERKDLEKLYKVFKGQYPKLDKELERLIKTDDENIVLVYARRGLEVIIADLCEQELKRPRGTEPLKGIIDKLNKEDKVPHNIVVSMQNLNSLSTFGAHPKDFDPRQVKPVLLDLATVLEWYQKYMGIKPSGEIRPETLTRTTTGPAGFRRESPKPGKKIFLVSGVILASAAIIVSLIVFDIIGVGKQAKADPIESVVILPFENYTGADTLTYFVAGMHSSLINDMGQVSGLNVICKTTSNAFKDADMTVNEIASELNVDAVIEADVMCLGDSICVNISLISVGSEEKLLWIGEFKEEKNQILNLYNRVTKKIASEVEVQLKPQEETLLSESRTVDSEAYDAYLKGLFYLDQFSKTSFETAANYFNLAIEIDPDWAPPYAGLAEVGMYQQQAGIVSVEIARQGIYKNINRALELDPNSANSHYTNAVFAVWTEWDWKKGEKEFLKALELNPNDAMCRMFYAHLLMILRRPDEAMTQCKLALELDPLRPFLLGLGGVVMRNAAEYQSEQPETH